MAQMPTVKQNIYKFYIIDEVACNTELRPYGNKGYSMHNGLYKQRRKMTVIWVHVRGPYDSETAVASAASSSSVASLSAAASLL